MISNNKLRTLYIMKILQEKSSEQYTLSSKDLIAELEKYDISANRKSIYSDIDTLREFGIDIIMQEGANPGYFIASREFELAELKLLVDVVQSSKFITKKKSESLIKKISKLTNNFEAKELVRDVIIFQRAKTDNEKIYYSVDIIHQALQQAKQIKFRYREWTVKKTMRLRHSGAMYQVSPWALCWADENYYLIAYDDHAMVMKHYRVDKIIDIELLDQERIGKDVYEAFDVASFTKKTFAMFAGQDEKVTLRCREDLVGVIIDRYGTDVNIRPVDDGYFHAILSVSVSSQFYGWLTGVGENAQILEPAYVREGYVKYLRGIMTNYE